MEVFTYQTERAIVRIHPGQRTEAERREALEKSVKEFYKAIQKELKENENRN